MQFFLYEIVARVVAIYLCYDCACQLRDGLAERKITYVLRRSADWLDFLVDWSPRQQWVAHRDTMPIRYWLVFASVAFTLLCCLGVAIFGWFHPNT